MCRGKAPAVKREGERGDSLGVPVWGLVRVGGQDGVACATKELQLQEGGWQGSAWVCLGVSLWGLAARMESSIKRSSCGTGRWCGVE